MRWVALVAGVLACGASAQSSGFDVTQVSRRVDLSGPYVRVSENVTLQSAEGLSKFLYAVPRAVAPHVAFLGARDEAGADLETERTPSLDTADAVLYRIRLLKAPQAKPASIKVSSVISNVFTPLPRAVGQNEPHLLVYEGDAGFFSPYPVAEVVRGARRVAPNVPTTPTPALRGFRRRGWWGRGVGGEGGRGWGERWGYWGGCGGEIGAGVVWAGLTLGVRVVRVGWFGDGVVA
jgi:Ribophorin I